MKPHRCIKTLPCALCRRNLHLIPRRPSTPPPRTPLPVVPCRFVGDDLTAADRIARHLDHRRKWAFCDHAANPLGEVVCACAGCGPRCSGYVADTPDADPLHPEPIIDHIG